MYYSPLKMKGTWECVHIATVAISDSCGTSALCGVHQMPVMSEGLPESTGTGEVVEGEGRSRSARPECGGRRKSRRLYD